MSVLASNGLRELSDPAVVDQVGPSPADPAAGLECIAGSRGTQQDVLAIDVVRRLVETPSVSGSESTAVGVFIELAARLGLDTSIDGAGNGLALRPSTGPERARIVLLGHIDTVPGHIPVRIEGDILHGRGSVDAKGPLATMLVAASRAMVEEGVALEVIAAVGEETAQSPGARFVAPRRRPAACIIGEPSGWDGVTLGYKGRLRLTVEVAGPSAHSAGPGGSASDIVTGWWSRARRWVDRMNDGRTGSFEIIQASVIGMSSGDDGLKQRARLSTGFRLPRWITPEQVERLLPSVESPDGFDVTYCVEGRELAHAVDRNDPIVRALSGAIRAAGGTPPRLKTGTADLNVVGPVWDCPIAAYGPGDSRLDHTPEERLDLGEYLRSIGVLELALSAASRDESIARSRAGV